MPKRRGPEEAGADFLPADGWIASATVFGRQDHDVIDWLRPTPARAVADL